MKVLAVFIMIFHNKTLKQKFSNLIGPQTTWISVKNSDFWPYSQDFD